MCSLILRLGLFSQLLLLSACGTYLASKQYSQEQARQAIERIVADSAARFGERPDIPGPDELHRLTPEQLADFHTFLDDPGYAHVPRHQRMYDYLENITDHFDYFEATLPASDALNLLSGNCMSLAVLTTALAKAAGIDIGYRLMEDVPVFEYQGDTVVKGQHLSTLLYDPDWTPPSPKGLYRRPGLQVDYFRSARTRVVANVGENHYLAMYYQNVAVENLTEGDLDTAYWYALESLQYDPFNAAAINTLAIVHRRHDEPAQAERLYNYGLATVEDRLSLLRNYRALVLSQGREADARRLQRELERKDNANPYQWIALASEAEADGDYDGAIRFYQKALELAPYMHEIQLGIALANYRAGHLDSAESALEKAITLVPAPETRNLYETKLRVLTSQLER